jgi:acyl-homoserine lactone acylase PvdQ
MAGPTGELECPLLYEGLRFPFLDVNEAQNWGEFSKAFSTFDAPGQNVVYADVDGNIGYHATGKVPIRAAGDGSLPVSGADDEHEWTSYIPFDELPSTFNPPSGIIAREWENHPGWVSEFGEHGMGGAMEDGADLSGTRIWADVFAGRHVDAADG